MSGYQHGIAWDVTLKTGNERIDSQHRRLFELMSELVSSSMDGSSAEKLGQTLNFLVDYTIRHFSDEEALQLEYKYPDYNRHKQLHDNFKAKVGELVGKYDAGGSSEELVSNVNSIVVKWLVTHIQNEDKKIGAHILAAK